MAESGKPVTVAFYSLEVNSAFKLEHHKQTSPEFDTHMD